MLGDQAVGKTCIVQRFLKGEFKVQPTTQGMDFKSKTMAVSFGTEKS
jgi:GTPase SAR1 family protein